RAGRWSPRLAHGNHRGGDRTGPAGPPTDLAEHRFATPGADSLRDPPEAARLHAARGEPGDRPDPPDPGPHGGHRTPRLRRSSVRGGRTVRTGAAVSPR